MKKYLIGIGVVAVLALVLSVLPYAAPKPVQKFGSYEAAGIAIVQSFNLAGFNLLTGTTAVNSLVQAVYGFSAVRSTSTAYTGAQFIATTNEEWLGTSAVATATLPTANAAYLAAGSPSFGSWESQVITNNSTNTVNEVAGAGMTFKCETNGVGTTTVTGGCAGNILSIPASTTVFVSGYWETSSTMKLLWGNMFY